MNSDKISKNSLVILRGSVCEGHHGGISVIESMIDVKRFKTG